MFQRLPEQPICPDDDSLGHSWVKTQRIVHQGLTAYEFCENCYITPMRILENQVLYPGPRRLPYTNPGANETEVSTDGEDTQGPCH